MTYLILGIGCCGRLYPRAKVLTCPVGTAQSNSSHSKGKPFWSNILCVSWHLKIKFADHQMPQQKPGHLCMEGGVVGRLWKNVVENWPGLWPNLWSAQTAEALDNGHTWAIHTTHHQSKTSYQDCEPTTLTRKTEDATVTQKSQLGPNKQMNLPSHTVALKLNHANRTDQIHCIWIGDGVGATPGHVLWHSFAQELTLKPVWLSAWLHWGN